MSLSYGFYNSRNGDRVYDAEQFSSFLDGIIYDGVYNAVGTKFYVEPGEGMQVKVGPGRAWFNHTWTLNTTKYSLDISTADSVYARIDAVVIEVNKSDRKNYLKIIKGSPASSPQRPTMLRTSNTMQYAVAYVRIPANSTTISQSNITYVVGTSETPLVSALALSGIPSGGTIGQVLAKESGESGAVGWHDVDKLPYNKWYLADGISESNVLGAFKFVSQSSENAARTSVNTSSSRTLTKSSTSITWNSSSGFLIPRYTSLHNSDIFNANPSTVIAKFSGGPSSGSSIIASCGTNRQMFIRTPYTYNGTSHGHTGPGCYYGSPTYSSDGSASQPIKANSSSTTSGILGCSFSSSSASMYLNGSSFSVNSISGITGGVSSGNFIKLIGLRDQDSSNTNSFAPERWAWNEFYLQYIVFYNSVLTAAQHAAIYRQINAE